MQQAVRACYSARSLPDVADDDDSPALPAQQAMHALQQYVHALKHASDSDACLWRRLLVQGPRSLKSGASEAQGPHLSTTELLNTISAALVRCAMLSGLCLVSHAATMTLPCRPWTACHRRTAKPL